MKQIAFFTICLLCALCLSAEAQQKTVEFGDIDYVTANTLYSHSDVEEIVFNGMIGHIDGYTITDFPNLKRIIFRGPINTTGGEQFVKDCPNLEEIRIEGLIMSTNFGEPVNCPKLKGYIVTGAVVDSYAKKWIPETSVGKVMRRPELVEQFEQLVGWQIKTLENLPDPFFKYMVLSTKKNTFAVLKKTGMTELYAKLDGLIKIAEIEEEKKPVDKRPKLEILKDSPAYKADDAQISFRYALPTDSLLTLTRNHYDLDAIAGDGDDISKIKNLLYWVHDLIPHNGGAEWPDCAFNIRDLEKAGKKRGLNCRFMAIMLTEALLAEGIPARYITCESKAWDTDSDCHVICVAWSRSLSKWVWVDPTHAAYVTDENGVMLHPGEVRHRLQNDLPLILNEDANWNHKEKTTKKEYIDKYMAKNLYIMSCNSFNQAQPEGPSENAKGLFIALVPEGSDYTRASVITTDYDKFWQAPSDAQGDDFVVQKMASQVKDYTLDSINLSTPLDYYLSRAWVRASGKQRLWAAISTSKFAMDADAPDEDVSDEYLSYIMNEHIDYVVTYRDSVASVVTHNDGEGYYLLSYCWIEDGRWVNGGQGLAFNMDEAEAQLQNTLPVHYTNLPRIPIINDIPKDVSPFAGFLKDVTSSPEQFVMDMLASHKLVINGEFHRRKVSWDMLKRLIALPEFSRKVGHVFLELPSWCQPMMDEFMAADTLDEEIVLQIFREEQMNGWWDSGEFEFICDLWHLNHSLPAEERISVVLADYQIPYSKITSKDRREAEDRNSHMAEVIARTITTSKDMRNSLFLVGCAHAYKSNQSGVASAAYGKEAEMTAAAQLADKLGAENVYTVFQHAISSDNRGGNRQAVRGGIFDKAFELNGNRPVGFGLAGSPFGNEPFDGIYEIKYNMATGSYSDNFDGYLFLHPLADEPAATPLTEIFTDEFVEEMKRRASVMGLENERGMWFGRPAQELTKEYIISDLLR